MDNFNRVKLDFETLMDKKTEADSLFPGFKIYERQEQHQNLYFPCMLFSIEEVGEKTQFFGSSGYIRGLKITIELAFKLKGDGYKYVDGNKLEADEVVLYYIDKLDTFFEDLRDSFDSSLNIETMIRDVVPQYPRESGQSLWGCIYTIGIYFYDSR